MIQMTGVVQSSLMGVIRSRDCH